MSTESAPADVPVWMEKLQTMSAFYSECHQEGNVEKFFEVYPVHQALQTDSGAGLATYSGARSDELSSDFQDALKGNGNALITEHKAGASTMEAMTDELKQDLQGGGQVDRQGWKQRLREQAERLKKQSAEIIDSKTKSAINLIEKLPESQRDTAADLWQTITIGFLKFWQLIWDTLQKAWETAVKFVLELWNNVAAYFKTVGDTFENVFQWLRSLF
jgi:hypothetical protein